MTREEFWAELAELAEGDSCRKLALALKVSSSTAARWLGKRGSPPKGLRTIVIEELRRQKKERAKLPAETPA